MIDDKEILIDFLQEITAINYEILSVLQSLNNDVNQPQEFLKFSNLIDRIYGTAATLGYKELADYCFHLKQVSRKTGNAEIKRIYKQVMKFMLNYTINFKLLKESIEDKFQEAEFSKMIAIDLKKMKNLEKDVFTFIDKKHNSIKT